MSTDHVREQWREQWLAWARGEQVAADRLEAAVDAALSVAGSGASVQAAAAAARLAGGRGLPSDAGQLQGELARAGVAQDEVAGLRPAGPVTPEALQAILGVFAGRRDALTAALAPGTPAAPAPAPATVP